jgi:hypothetical protein
MGNQLHTPGPWRVEWIRNSVYIKADDTDRDISICRVMTHRNSNNASLLVNAPELLEHCERLLGFALHYGDAFALEAGQFLIQSAKETIAKAKGETNA